MPAIHPENDLVPFLRGELNAEEHGRMQQHLDGCAQCRQATDALSATMLRVSARLEELPTPEWTAYRRELRLKLAQRTEARSQWWRPALAWASLGTAAVGLAGLILELSMLPPSHRTTPEVDQLAMEQSAEPIDVDLLRNYAVIEKLDLLEDYDVIEHLDELPAAEHNHDSRS